MSREELEKMTLAEAQRQLSNSVYAAALIVEKLETAGKIAGNGHHARQKIAQFAVDDLAKRWNP